MIEVVPYEKSMKSAWDKVVSKSRADTFLFYRGYMDYHAERFSDCSFMILRKGKVAGVLPGNSTGKIFHSHQGLTYGGLVSGTGMLLRDVIEAFRQINEILVERGLTNVIYKPMPYIYHKQPAQEDIYVLFRLGARKIACNISSAIFQSERFRFNESRKSGVRKAQKAGLIVEKSQRLECFWKILEENLKEQYNLNPVHSIDEISRLARIFPDNIQLFVTLKNDELLAGTLLFVMNRVVHVQYIAANMAGKNTGALDLLFHTLIEQTYSDKACFDFGHSNENQGRKLNENLVFQKEGFGGRGVVYEAYSYDLT